MNGTVNRTAGSINGGTINFNFLSIYNHSVSGQHIPTATWAVNSTCNITATLANNSSTGQTFGNVIWNGGILTLANNFKCNGNLTISGGTLTSATNITHTIGGDLIVNGGTFVNNGTIDVLGNLLISSGTFNIAFSTERTLNLGGNFTQTGGTLKAQAPSFICDIVFNGTSPQVFDRANLSAPSGIFNFTVDNPEGLTLNSSVDYIRDLTLTQGNVYTGSNVLTMGTSPTNRGELHWTSGTIIGNFKRWFNVQDVNVDVLFPVGTAEFYRPANLKFTSRIGSGTITASFIDEDPGKAGIPFYDGVIPINNVGIDGYWRLTIGDGFTSSTYSLDLTASGFNGINDYETLHLLKRANSSSPWIVQGTHVASTGTLSDPVVHRTGMSGFSEFGIGSPNNPLPVELESFNALLIGKDVKLTWNTVTEVNNFGFDIERQNKTSLHSGEL
ncbi:MAG: hypothetical protein RBR74_10060, partial [Ignavibacteriaceae bacterium]|nr:hypothetical protein [Ignavibacteriaceae bacterium]